MAAPPADELARVSAGETGAADRLRRALAERDALPDHEAAAVDLKPADPVQRLEAVLIEQRIEQMVSRQLKADRLEPSALTYKIFGPYPHASEDAGLAWHEGAHALYTYRQRHGISDEANPLGATQPRGAAARAERARAQRRIERAQRQLGRAADRGVQRSAARAPGIGR